MSSKINGLSLLKLLGAVTFVREILNIIATILFGVYVDA